MVPEEPKESSPENRKRSTPKQPENGGKDGSIFSPRFRSVAAMAGWDEEALLNASLVVEDTPERNAKQKRRCDLQFKTPPTNSRRKRRVQRKSPVSITVTVLNLDEDDCEREDNLKSIKEKAKINEPVDEKIGNGELGAAASCSSSAIPCMDKLREELSCAICLEICFEPSTTPCGHSFCKKCLRSAADKCGKRCPKCRQLISNGRSCTVNTVLWNTIQLLFPQEVEARKAAKSQSPPVRVNRNRNIRALNSPEGEGLSLERRRSNHNLRNRIVRPSVTLGSVNDNFTRRTRNVPSQDEDDAVLSRGDDNFTRRRRRDVPSQDEDAALALRLQREEFMGAFRGPEDQQQQHGRSSFMLASANLRRPEEQQQQQQHRRNSVTLASANLRAMASRAINIRLRGRATY